MTTKKTEKTKMEPQANNMHIWDQVKRPPKSALKQISGGRLKGKTDISPQWRYEAITRIFGPCGIGWKYEIVHNWQERLAKDEIACFAVVNLYLYVDDNGNPYIPGRTGCRWSEPIPGIGGSKLVEQEKGGLHSNDEGYKMAVTDALSVALKMIGVAADIYMGLWDGSKYENLPATKTNKGNGHQSAGEEKPDPTDDRPKELKQALWGLITKKYRDKEEAKHLHDWAYSQFSAPQKTAANTKKIMENWDKVTSKYDYILEIEALRAKAIEHNKVVDFWRTVGQLGYDNDSLLNAMPEDRGGLLKALVDMFDDIPF